MGTHGYGGDGFISTVRGIDSMGAFAARPHIAKALQYIGLTPANNSAMDLLMFDASLVVPTGGDNRPTNTALAPRIIAF